MLDVYLSDTSRFSSAERTLLIKGFYKILEDNVDIVEEIGWDIPELLLDLFDLDWCYGDNNEEKQAIRLIMRGFEIVAKNGNPKETFLKSIELLNDLDFSHNEGKDELILDLKIYALLELVSSSLKRINTIYPSKFLSMALSALLKAYSQYLKHTTLTRFIARRLYSFARDYIPPLKPAEYLEEHGISQKEAQMIDDDENYLQRTLLQSFITNVVGLATKERSLSFSAKFCNDLKLKCTGQKVTHERGDEIITSTTDCFLRILTLSESFDMDMYDEFEKLKKDSMSLLSKVVDSKSDDAQIQDYVKISVSNKIETMYNPQSKTIPLNDVGILYLTVLEFYEKDQIPDLTIQEAIALHLRFLSPGLFSEQFKSKGALDGALFYDWAAITHATPEQLAKVPHYQIILFLQTIVYYSSTDDDEVFRWTAYTFLVRVLCMLEESIAYNFLIDTLTTAPFDNAKAAVINILKDLCIRTRPDVDSLAEKLQDASLTESKERTTKPALPQRRYIHLSIDRTDDIYALIRECIDETFDEKVQSVDTSKFKILLGYLNFLVGVKDQFPKNKIKEIVVLTEDKLAKAPSTELDDDAANLEFASMACDLLNKFLDSSNTSL